MKKAVVVYWSGTGNTELMAKAVASGIESNQHEVELLRVEDASAEKISNAELIALGCPSMGAEVLEEDFMEPFVELLKNENFSTKRGVLFGSYDWGDGEWMRDWQTRMVEYGLDIVEDGLILHMTPDEDGLAQCENLGKCL